MRERSIGKRRLLTALLLLGLLAAGALVVHAAVASAVAPARAVSGGLPVPARRPNVVFILTDDLDLLLRSVDSMPRVKALLADRGTTFSHFFVPLSLCCPSRATILLGQYPHNHKIFTNDVPDGGFDLFRSLGHESATLGPALQEAGYRTFLAGKYMNGYPDAAERTYIPPGWDEWHVPSNDDAYSQFNYELNDRGILDEFGGAPADYLTDVLRARAHRFLLDHRGSAQPFFLYVAPYAPHKPATPAPRHANLFPKARVPRTPSFNEADVSDKPRQYRDLPPLSADDIRNLDALYRLRLQSLQAVDDLVAKLVETLAATGELDNTYIFFTSDNGFHMGQHRLLASKYTAYEEDIRIPLIVRGPGVPAGRVVDALASTVDLAPTFAQLTGTTLKAAPDGRSLVPLWRAAAPPATWRRAILLEQPRALGGVSGENAGAAGGPRQGHAGVLEPPDDDGDPLEGRIFDPVPLVGLRTQGFKYVEYANGDREYYDLVADPYELANQAGHLAPARLAQLARALKKLSTCAGEGCRVADTLPGFP
jgi:N-acetylglucosamine-6-sulfatase